MTASTDLASGHKTGTGMEVFERLIIDGDLSNLGAPQRVAYYRTTGRRADTVDPKAEAKAEHFDTLDWYAMVAGEARKQGIPIPVVPDDAGEEWFQMQGKRLRAETKSVLGGTR